MDQINTIISDEALNDVAGGGITSALTMGGTYAILGAGAGGIAAGPVGAVAASIVGGVTGFIGGMFVPDNAPASAPRTSRRLLNR